MRRNLLGESDTFHEGYKAVKKSLTFFIKELGEARKKYKSFDDKWELDLLKRLIRSL